MPSKKPTTDKSAKKTTKKTAPKVAGKSSSKKSAPVIGPEPTHQEIAARAFVVWERKGKPHGQDYWNWKEAEAELRAERGLI